MKTKEAIRFCVDLQRQAWNMYFESYDDKKQEYLEGVIELLQRGEKFEEMFLEILEQNEKLWKMWDELRDNYKIKHFYYLWDNSKAKEKKIYLGETLNDLEQKYFSKKGGN